MEGTNTIKRLMYERELESDTPFDDADCGSLILASVLSHLEGHGSFTCIRGASAVQETLYNREFLEHRRNSLTMLDKILYLQAKHVSKNGLAELAAQN